MEPRNISVNSLLDDISFAYAWYCIPCDEELDLSARDAHLDSDAHARKTQGQGSNRSTIVKEAKGENNTKINNTIPTEPPSMIWTCSICDKDVNIFARTDHLNSKPHIKQLRKQQQQIQTTEKSTTEEALWTCTVCEQTMHILYQEEHLAGKPHTKMLNKKGLPLDYVPAGVALPEYANIITDHTPPPVPPVPPVPITQSAALPDIKPSSRPSITQPQPKGPPPPPNTISNTVTASEKYHCSICNTDCPAAFQQLHHSKSWICTICQQQTHFDWRHRHLAWHAKTDGTASTQGGQSPGITSRLLVSTQAAKVPHTSATPEVPESMLYCAVCEKTIQQAQKSRHQRPAWKCSLCQVVVHEDWMEGHIAGLKHQEKVKAGGGADVEVGSSKAEDENFSVTSTNAAYNGHDTPAPTAIEDAPVPRCETCGGKIGGNRGAAKRHRTPGWECNICDKMMHIIDKRSHEAGSKHAQKLEGQEKIQARRAKKATTVTPIAPTYRRPEKTHEPPTLDLSLATTETPFYELNHGVLLPVGSIEADEVDSSEGEDTLAAPTIPTYNGHDTPTSTTPNPKPGKLHCDICGKNFRATKKAIRRHQMERWDCKLCGKTIHLPKKKRHEATRTHILKKEAAEKIQATRGTDFESSKTEEDNLASPGTWTTSTSNRHDTPGFTASTAMETPEAYMTHCNICNKNFRATPESMERQQRPIWECDACEKTIYHTKKEVHEATSFHIRNDRNMQKIRNMQSNKAKAATTSTSATPTYGGPEVAHENSPTSSADPDTFFCEICDKDIKKAKDKMRFHKSRAWECKVCDITTHLAWKRSHNEGSKHLKNLELQQEMAAPPGE